MLDLLLTASLVTSWLKAPRPDVLVVETTLARGVDRSTDWFS